MELRNFKGPLLGVRQFLAVKNPLKMMKKFFFHVNSSFRSQEIYTFVLTFLVM